MAKSALSKKLQAAVNAQKRRVTGQAMTAKEKAYMKKGMDMERKLLAKKKQVVGAQATLSEMDYLGHFDD